jgi:hypothetical protein
VIFAAISTYLLWHKAFKNSRYTEGYAGEFLKTLYQQHLSTPHPQKSLNSGPKKIFFSSIMVDNIF